MIKKLYKLFYSTLTSKNRTRQDKYTGNNKCTVCMEEINNNNVCKLSCGHYYCLDCIIELKKHSNKCPCCRSIVFNNENISSQSSYIVEEEITPILVLPSTTVNPNYDINETILYINTNTQKPYTFEQYESELSDEVRNFYKIFLSQS